MNTFTDGIFLAGCCQGPKDIPDTVAQAGAAAAEALALIDAGSVEMEPNTAYVVEEACSGCRTCVPLCPYSAIVFDSEKNRAHIQEVLVQGLRDLRGGLPVAVRSGSTCSRTKRSSRRSKEFWRMSELTQIAPAVEAGKFEPKIVAFFCNWCTYLAADLAGTSRMKYAPNTRVIRVMCSGRVDPQFILEAFARGRGRRAHRRLPPRRLPLSGGQLQGAPAVLPA